MLARSTVAGAVIPALAAFLAVATVGTSPGWCARSSRNLASVRVSVTGGGETASSAHFETTVVVAQESIQGASSFCNSGFVTSAGFWSMLGDLPVPIELRLDKDEIDPKVTEFTWTGNDPWFRLYRSSSPIGIVAPANLFLVKSNCSGKDPQPVSNIVFYKVVSQSGVSRDPTRP